MASGSAGQTTTPRGPGCATQRLDKLTAYLDWELELVVQLRSRGRLWPGVFLISVLALTMAASVWYCRSGTRARGADLLLHLRERTPPRSARRRLCGLLSSEPGGPDCRGPCSVLRLCPVKPLNFSNNISEFTGIVTQLKCFGCWL